MESWKILRKKIVNWISCGDQMPEEDQHVLVYPGFADTVYSCIYLGGKWGDFETIKAGPFAMSEIVEDVSHWMPVPEAPES